MGKTDQGVIKMWGSRGIENDLNKVVQGFNELDDEVRRISNEIVAGVKDQKGGVGRHGPLAGLNFGLSLDKLSLALHASLVEETHH